MPNDRTSDWGRVNVLDPVGASTQRRTERGKCLYIRVTDSPVQTTTGRLESPLQMKKTASLLMASDLVRKDDACQKVTP